MYRILRAESKLEEGKNLREGVDGQPEHLCGAAQSGAQFVQLEMRELQGAKRALVQGLRAPAR